MKFSDSENVKDKSQNHNGVDVVNENGMQVSQKSSEVLIKNLKCLSWNINGGFEEKIKDEKFKNFICTYDIVFLSECWINNTCNIEIDDFVCKSIPLSRKCINKGVVCM